MKYIGDINQYQAAIKHNMCIWNNVLGIFPHIGMFHKDNLLSR